MSPTPGAHADHADLASAYARLFDRARDGLYVGTLGRGVDPDVTLAANASARTLFGYPDSIPASEFRPLAISSFVDLAARTALLDRLTADGGVENYRLRLKKYDGTAAEISLTARVERESDTGGLTVEAMLCLADPSTANGGRPASLTTHAERMVALGQTVSGVAHELNNPLASIINWSERLSEQPGEDPRRGLELILSEARRAARVVRNLLMFSHKRESTRAVVDINRLVRDTLALRSLDHQAARIDVVAELAPALPGVLGDCDQLQQVLLNLCINAEQSMVAARGRGVLTIRTACEVSRRSILITVRDDGPGISAQTRGHVFEPFFTTKSPGSGTGLGLTVARSIAREHGGDIRLEPAASATRSQAEPGPGATFTVILPICQQHEASPAARTPRT